MVNETYASGPARKRGPGKRTIILCTLGMPVAAALIWFLGAVVAPLVHTHVVVKEYARREGAGHALSRLGGKQRAADRLIRYSRLFPGADQKNALMILAFCGPSGVPTLIEALEQQEDADKRILAVQLLGRFGHVGHETRNALPALKAALRDSDWLLRDYAVEALGRIGPAKEVVPLLIEALRDQKAPVRGAAARTLGKIGPAAREAVPSIVVVLNDKRTINRYDAATALGKIGLASEIAVTALKKAQADKDPALRKCATDALEKIMKAKAKKGGG
jgi:HEAT repeat protein/PBS lyase HEAT-like repeat-containing protein